MAASDVIAMVSSGEVTSSGAVTTSQAIEEVLVAKSREICRVQRLSPDCPHCGGSKNEWRQTLAYDEDSPFIDSEDVTLHTIQIGQWVMTWLHCEWCQADYDPLDAEPLDSPIKLESKNY